MIEILGNKYCKIIGCNTKISVNSKVTRCGRCCRLNVKENINETYRNW